MPRARDTWPDERVGEAWELHMRGYTFKDLAVRYGCTAGSVRKAVYRYQKRRDAEAAARAARKAAAKAAEGAV